ncbi:hypothetical protein [Lewinella sp. 4G2]|uniref:hypothetical protein n=1 Tax=Lewinella sp. 4G2 TaxID=1803372 RepID=UPI0007B4E224|nr:hypothetical protein [Lewinella sp. 4G2]OAV46203.1 hypothetical protein A3850_018270 [Lewinella sp. 4G2]
MKYFLTSALCVLALSLMGQTAKPAYCNDDGPVAYGSVVGVDAPTTAPAALPAFGSLPVTEYKVQVAILRYSDPSEFPFHSSLVARYRPCEEVWVIESRESFADRSEAQDLQMMLKDLGYSGAFITDLVGYQ